MSQSAPHLQDEPAEGALFAEAISAVARADLDFDSPSGNPWRYVRSRRIAATCASSAISVVQQTVSGLVRPAPFGAAIAVAH